MPSPSNLPIPKELLDILVCPETKEALTVADDSLIEALNVKIAQSLLKNRAGNGVSEPIDAGLVRPNGEWLYPIRDGIPVMLIDEAVPTK